MRDGIRNRLRLWRPSTWKPSWRAARVLLFDYGHLKSVSSGRPVGADGQPIPWYTYPAVEYLEQLDFSGCSVFEYGSGNSTLFWAARAAQVISVEDDEIWHRLMLAKVPANCRLIHQEDLARYVDAIEEFPAGFDVIVVDGAARGLTRLKCARAAVPYLKPGGMIILDNADWLPESARTLRNAGLIEVDMTGPVAISGDTQTTSFFLHRDFSRPPRTGRQPEPGPGAASKVWEFPPPTEPPVVEFGGEVFAAVRRDQAFTVHTPAAPRAFRLLVAGRSQCGADTAAILDVDRGRVLLTITEPAFSSQATVEQELSPAASMRWDEFLRFVNGHPQRRYRLEA